MTRQSVYPGSDPRHVSLVALPDAVVSTLSGIFDVMNAFALMDVHNARAGARVPFHIETVGEAVGPLELASGVPINVQRAVAEIETTDIVIIPSVLLRPEGFSHFVTSIAAPVASGGSMSPGGACTHWKTPPLHGARQMPTVVRKGKPS